MKKVRTFPASELIYQEKDGVYYAISLSFDLLAEGDNADVAMERLRDATESYLAMCINDNESDEEIYRSAPGKFWNIPRC